MDACIIFDLLYSTFGAQKNILRVFYIFIQDRKDARQGETINIFSVASGHLYVSISRTFYLFSLPSFSVVMPCSQSLAIAH